MTDSWIKGHCPACNRAGLFVGEGGYVTCSHLACPEPDAASTLLEKGNLRTLATVADTLRIISSWGRTNPETMGRLAEEIGSYTDMACLHPCCPVCQEVVCDTGCPLESVRMRTRS